MKNQKTLIRNLINNPRKLLILIFLGLSLSIFSQESDEAIHKAFHTSDIKELTKYFNHTLQLTIPNANGNYSKIQAKAILGNFFDLYPAKEIKVLKDGDIRLGQHFCIIAYKSQVKNFQIYYQFDKKNNSFLIREIQIREKK